MVIEQNQSHATGRPEAELPRQLLAQHADQATILLTRHVETGIVTGVTDRAQDANFVVYSVGALNPSPLDVAVRDDQPPEV